MAMDYWEERDRQTRTSRDEEEKLRMEAFDAGLCSYAAAIEGGARYQREIAESALELKEETGITEPIGMMIERASADSARRAA